MKGGRHTKHEDGTYHIAGKKFELLEGSRAQVWHGTAHKTAGGLTKSKLLKNKHGRIVSKSKHESAKKGKFGAVKMSSKSTRKYRRRS